MSRKVRIRFFFDLDLVFLGAKLVQNERNAKFLFELFRIAA
jgi:hypothetical protein